MLPRVRKDLAFTRELARRRIVLQDKLLSLLEHTPIDEPLRIAHSCPDCGRLQ
jgi:hypothetical protein